MSEPTPIESCDCAICIGLRTRANLLGQGDVANPPAVLTDAECVTLAYALRRTLAEPNHPPEFRENLEIVRAKVLRQMGQGENPDV